MDLNISMLTTSMAMERLEHTLPPRYIDIFQHLHVMFEYNTYEGEVEIFGEGEERGKEEKRKRGKKGKKELNSEAE